MEALYSFFDEVRAKLCYQLAACFQCLIFFKLFSRRFSVTRGDVIFHTYGKFALSYCEEILQTENRQDEICTLSKSCRYTELDS